MATETADPLATLLDLHSDLSRETDLGVVLERVGLATKQLLHADRATVFVVDNDRNEVWSRVLTESEVREIRLPLDGRSLAAEVARSGRMLRIDEPYEDPRFDPSVDARTGYRTRSLLIAPVTSRDGRRLGVLQAINHLDGPFTDEEERFGAALAATAAVALEHALLQGELALERLRVVRVADDTRQRLARDLHDGVAQTIANAAMGIEIAQKRAATDVGGAIADLSGIRERLLASQHELRNILFALRPVALAEDGLAAAVRALAARMDGTNGAAVTARRVEDTRRLAPEVESGAFTVVREAVNNAVKNGQATRVSVDVFETPTSGAVSAIVEDDGRGFDVATTLATYASRGSLGLLQMRESARLIGAELSIDSAPGQGTRVSLRIPG